MMKLSLPDQLIAERKCFNKISSQPQGKGPEKLSEPDWDLFLPE